jgi:uncharacterized membrane protein
MARTSSTTHIDAPLDRVMGIIRDVENYPKWTSGISDVKVCETDSQGRPVRTTFQIAGGTISDLVELGYKWDSDSVEWHLINANAITALDGAYRLSPVGDGCDVTYELSVEVNLPLPSFILSAGEKTIVTSALEGLKEFAK